MRRKRESSSEKEVLAAVSEHEEHANHIVWHTPPASRYEEGPPRQTSTAFIEANTPVVLSDQRARARFPPDQRSPDLQPLCRIGGIRSFLDTSQPVLVKKIVSIER